MSSEFRLGELFCGPGGMALGAKLASEEFKKEHEGGGSIRHIWGVDIDPAAIDTYNKNNLGIGIKTDARDFVNGEKDSPVKTINSFERINALAFGFPCNDFSFVGERKGMNGKFGSLYKAGVRVLDLLNPKFFVAENVSGIHSVNLDAAFYQILSDLENAGSYGYNLTTHLYKFEEYGVAQMRHRYIIVGIRKDLNLTFKVPAPTHVTPVTASEKLAEKYDVEPKNNEILKQDYRVEERLLFTPPWHNAWCLDKILKMNRRLRRRYLKENLPWFDEKLAKCSDMEIEYRLLRCKLNCKKARMSHIYRRLHPDKPAYTLTGSGGGGTHGYHWEECRALTNRERARLQSFPDDFFFCGSTPQVRKQIGMAVPPLGAKIIFSAILKTFKGIKYEALSQPSYTPMEPEAFRLYRHKRYKTRLREKLRINSQFPLDHFSEIEPFIDDFIESELSLSDAVKFITSDESVS